MNGRSGIWSFALEPKGASFAMTDEHEFIWSVLPTDVDFGYDGRIWVSDFAQISQSQRIRIFEHEEARADPRVAEVVALVTEGLAGHSVAELAALLAHADQRIRQRAQFELVAREHARPLAAIATDLDATRLARIHAIWGLGQLGTHALREAFPGPIDAAVVADDEIRAQVARIAGENPADWLAPQLEAWLEDPSDRVRFFAAQSLGTIGDATSIAPLLALARDDADRDPFLRHAVVHALERLDVGDALQPHGDDPSPAVRMAVVLVMRRSGDPRIARFLDDPEPRIVVEAARAIYDVPIDGAMSELAARAGRESPFSDDDPQTSLAYHRRVIGAALRVRTTDGATGLAAHAADVSNPSAMRQLALETLGRYADPAPRDLAMSWWRPLPAVDRSVAHEAFDRHGRALANDPALGDRALEIAATFDRLPLSNDELLDLVADTATPAGRRLVALRAVAARGAQAASQIDLASQAALHSDDPALRAEARGVLAERHPEAALEALGSLPDEAPRFERQRALATLSVLDVERRSEALEPGLVGLVSGTLDEGLALDVIEAIERGGTPEQRARLDAWRERKEALGPVEGRDWALAGGDVARGEAVFQSVGDCQRCHGTSGHGGGVGPPLAGIGQRQTSRHLLESVVAPQASVVDGFGVVTLSLRNGQTTVGTFLAEDQDGVRIDVAGEERVVAAAEIMERSEPQSAMPPLGLTLAPGQLRDLIAYLGTL